MTRIRTIAQTAKLIREQDPESAITEKTLRRDVKDGKLVHRKVGTRILLDFERVCEYYGCCAELNT